MDKKKRKLPNILITGTPGVGKTTIAKDVAKRTGLEWLNVGDIAKEEDCMESYDESYECPIIDEDKVLDAMEERMSHGGKLVEYHGCDFFPERWFDGVFVVRTNNTELYDRLLKRGYQGKKLTDNVECEIFQTILEEARESYRSDIVFELKNDDEEELESNVKTVIDWIKDWRR